jgi:DNA-binding NarL/FixJ family response regulator
LAKLLKKIKILLIEDNRLLRDGISAMLKKQNDMQVVATVGNGENILSLMKKVNPNVVLLDLGLRNRNSLNTVKLIKKNHQETKIIVMDLIPLQTDIYDFVQAGVSGFMLKDINVAEFLKTIRSINNGAKILPNNLTESLFSQIVSHAVNGSRASTIKESVHMTRREKQVVELIADGYSNKEIAQKLHLSPYTIKSHVHNILEKLALNTRVQIAKHAHFSDDFKNALDSTSLISEE